MTEAEFHYTLEDTEEPDENGYVAFVWERFFFSSFIYNYGTLTEACNAAGVTEELVNARVEESPTFAGRLREQRQRLADMVRREVFRRAVEPTEVPIYQRGVLVGKRLEWDTRHLQWVAERLLPHEFHLPSRVEFSGDGDGSVNFKLELDPGKREEED